MKTIKFFSAALFVLAASACNTDYTTENFSNLEPMTIAGIETKTALNQADGSVNWTAGDQIAIYDKLGGTNIFNNTSDYVASFSGNVTAGTKQFWGVYPTKLITGFNNRTVTMTLPSDQTPVAGTFAEELNISVTSGMKTPGTELVEGISFHNVCGLISFTVPKNIAADTVTFSSNNTPLCGTLSVNCSTSEAELISNQSKSVSMTGDFEPGSTFYFVVAPGQIEGFCIDVKTKNGSYYSKSASNGSINVTAGSLTRLGQISFKAVTASAEHTYDEDGVLTGSSLTVNHGIPQNMWNDVTNLNVTVTKGGTQYRDYSKSGITDATVVPLGKTYLPHGTYDVKVEYTMNGVTTEGKTTVTLEKPNFTGTVSVSGTTSFSLFQKGNITGANSHNAETISNITATCDAVNKISSTVLAQCPVNYSITLDGSTPITSGTNKATVLFGDKKDVAWGSHTLAASFTFDGITISNSAPCHITGLPYKSTNFMEEAPTFTSTNEVEKWIKQGTTKQQGGRGHQIYYYYYYLFGTTKETGNIFSPAVQIPTGSIPISYKVGINFYTSGTGTGQTVDIHTGATTNLSKVKTNVKNITRGTSYNNKVTEISGNDTMYNNSRISISHNEAGLSKNAAENWVLVTYLHIDYRK